MNYLVVRLAKDCCSILDFNMQMDHLYNYLSSRYGIYPIHPDGVHPNIIGNLLLGKSLLNYLKIATPNNAGMRSIFVKEMKLAYGGNDHQYMEIFNEIESQSKSNLLIFEEPIFDFFDLWITIKASIIGSVRFLLALFTFTK
jgi:hypothetical protein